MIDHIRHKSDAEHHPRLFVRKITALYVEERLFINALTIDNGSIVVNGTGFGATSTEMTLLKGNLTLNKPMRDTLNKVISEIVSGEIL